MKGEREDVEMESRAERLEGGVKRLLRFVTV
jgi:hypothetical protein